MPYMPLSGSAALEVVSLPSCRLCKCSLGGHEMRWGTGLCNNCYSTVRKDCRLCHLRIPSRQLHWDSGVCSTCFHACDRNCRLCGHGIALRDLDFRIGLCNSCYRTCAKKCKMCQAELELGQLWWGTGLCDTCYGTWHVVCKMCKTKPQGWQKHWSTGLCDSCHDACAQACCSCKQDLPLGSLYWRLGLCDDCGRLKSSSPYGCTTQSSSLVAFSNFQRARSSPSYSGILEGTEGSCPLNGGSQWACLLCKEDIHEKTAHWCTGLCDRCYTEAKKVCRSCRAPLHFGQRHWDIALCDTCHSACIQSCKTCKKTLSQKEQSWGFQFCDSCFDKCDKACSECKKKLDLRQLHWGTGVCDSCYDGKDQHDAVGLSKGVWAAICAQFVFYMAPEMLKPSLFLQIKSAGYKPDAPRVYAWVQTIASVAAMVAPLPVGQLAECKGKRVVYCSICFAGIIAAVAFAASPPAAVFALAWATINLPPAAMRGVRQAFFANTVPIRELTRAGQLASSVGVIGGFVGPVTSALLAGTSNAFVSGACIAMVIFALCTISLWVCLPRSAGSADELDNSPGAVCPQWTSDRYDSFGGENRKFRDYVLVCFCTIATLLEVSLNAGVMSAFQPVVVEHFGWQSSAIAKVNSAGALLSIAISLVVAQLRPPECLQAMAAAGCYLAAVLAFLTPPLAEWRLVLGVMLGISAQIMLYAPLEAIFAQLIGRTRVTTQLATVLSLAPAVGTAFGTFLAPYCVAWAGSPAALVAATPAFVAVTAMMLELAFGGRILGGVSGGLSNAAAAEATPTGPLAQRLLATVTGERVAEGTDEGG